MDVSPAMETMGSDGHLQLIQGVVVRVPASQCDDHGHDATFRSFRLCISWPQLEQRLHASTAAVEGSAIAGSLPSSVQAMQVRQCKMVYLVRHAQAAHNAAEAAVGTKHWERDLARDGRFLDAELTDVGVADASTSGRQAFLSAASRGMPKIETVIVSPLSRAIQTALQLFPRDQQDAVPMLADELCREKLGVHACDQRRTRSELEQRFPMVDFSALTTDSDVLWSSVYRERDDELEIRAWCFLHALVRSPRIGVHVAVVTHSGFIRACCRALAARSDSPDATFLDFQPLNCEVVPLPLEHVLTSTLPREPWACGCRGIMGNLLSTNVGAPAAPAQSKLEESQSILQAHDPAGDSKFVAPVFAKDVKAEPAIWSQEGICFTMQRLFGWLPDSETEALKQEQRFPFFRMLRPQQRMARTGPKAEAVTKIEMTYRRLLLMRKWHYVAGEVMELARRRIEMHKSMAEEEITLQAFRDILTEGFSASKVSISGKLKNIHLQLVLQPEKEECYLTWKPSRKRAPRIHLHDVEEVVPVMKEGNKVAPMLASKVSHKRGFIIVCKSHHRGRVILEVNSKSQRNLLVRGFARLLADLNEVNPVLDESGALRKRLPRRKSCVDFFDPNVRQLSDAQLSGSGDSFVSEPHRRASSSNSVRRGSVAQDSEAASETSQQVRRHSAVSVDSQDTIVMDPALRMSSNDRHESPATLNAEEEAVARRPSTTEKRQSKMLNSEDLLGLEQEAPFRRPSTMMAKRQSKMLDNEDLQELEEEAPARNPPVMEKRTSKIDGRAVYLAMNEDPAAGSESKDHRGSGKMEQFYQTRFDNSAPGAKASLVRRTSMTSAH
ncbi:TPA: hypothetical protein N0F65_012536 [Lagenidium giganteum]|uniref:Uncharacterized protein n=1 Tax=Lagenidium giganteum TaxID=4803 RepID=A0AAV2YJR3_9STRA|nr:TPA: hypothetical protein N0F65_012536 [Lagenidium giganteum]